MRTKGVKEVKEVKEGKEHRKNWRELYASIDDIKQFLLERVILRHNVITQQTEVHVIEQAPKPPDEATAADGGSRHRAGTEAAGRGDGTAGGLRAVAERVAGVDKAHTNAHPLPLPKGGD